VPSGEEVGSDERAAGATWATTTRAGRGGGAPCVKATAVDVASTTTSSWSPSSYHPPIQVWSGGLA